MSDTKYMSLKYGPSGRCIVSYHGVDNEEVRVKMPVLEKYDSGFVVSCRDAVVSRVGTLVRASGFRFWVSGFGVRISSFGLGFRIPGFGFRVSGSGLQVSGFGFRV